MTIILVPDIGMSNAITGKITGSLAKATRVPAEGLARISRSAT